MNHRPKWGMRRPEWRGIRGGVETVYHGGDVCPFVRARRGADGAISALPLGIQLKSRIQLMTITPFAVSLLSCLRTVVFCRSTSPQHLVRFHGAAVGPFLPRFDLLVPLFGIATRRGVSGRSWFAVRSGLQPSAFSTAGRLRSRPSRTWGRGDLSSVLYGLFGREADDR